MHDYVRKSTNFKIRTIFSFLCTFKPYLLKIAMHNSTVLVPHITVLQLKSNNVLTKQHKQHRALP
jgi:hypothetical protein